jgi:acyl carrier protein
MKHFIITLLVLPQVLLCQNLEQDIFKATTTFSDPHINKWMVIQKYLERNDTMYYTEANYKKNKFESWDEVSFLVSNSSNILIADLNEKTAYILPSNLPKKNRRQNAIELDDSLAFIFDNIQEDTIIKTDSGYSIQGQSQHVEIFLDSTQNLIIGFEIRTELDSELSDQEESHISTEWRLITHSIEQKSAEEITSWEKYIKIEKGKFALNGELNTFELIDLINE